MTPPLHALLFDLDDTLWDRSAAMRGVIARWLTRHYPEYASAVREAAVTEILAWDGGGDCNRVAFAARWLAAWPATREADRGADCDASGPDADMATQAHWAAVQQDLVHAASPDPRILAMLARLATRWPLALVTNGTSATQRGKLLRTGLDAAFHPQRIVVAGEAGVAKPDSRIFAQALGALGNPQPETCLFVGNHPVNDIAGAAAQGMRTCWIRHSEAAYPAALPSPTWTLNAILDLEA